MSLSPGGPCGADPSDDEAPDVPTQAPRPPGSYPRSIEHQERVEYRYDPETGEFDARTVESTEPVVTQWDMSAPERSERPVGTWDVTPTDDGVEVQNAQRVTVPDDVKERLRKESAETGGAASTTTTLRYEHDLDTGSTSSGPRERSTSEIASAMVARRRSQGQDGLPPEYRQILQGLMKQQKERPAGGGRQRRASRSENEKKPSFKLPTIVVVQEPTSGRRVGGL